MLTLMKPAPIQRNRLKTWSLGDFDMLKPNLTSKTFEYATQTSKWRKTTSNFDTRPGFFGTRTVFLALDQEIRTLDQEVLALDQEVRALDQEILALDHAIHGKFKHNPRNKLFKAKKDIRKFWQQKLLQVAVLDYLATRV